MFKYLITIQPLGFMYGSAGAFLSPENLVGRSGAKFPPDAATLSGLFFSANKDRQFATHEELRDKLYVAGPFWAMVGNEEYFYVPLPRHKVIKENTSDEWLIKSHKWCLKSKADSEENGDEEEQSDKNEDESEYHWLKIDYWDENPEDIREALTENPPSVAAQCWEYVSILHPQLKKDQRHVLAEDGLFLENAVQLKPDYCLVYLSNYQMPGGWYRFGGEGHLVEIETHALSENHKINQLLGQKQKIQHAFALITPGVWGSNRFSYRYPLHPDFPREGMKMLTNKAIPYRYRVGQSKKNQPQENTNKNPTGRLSRGRYAVPAGSVYVFKHPLEMTWWDFPDGWFPKEGFSLKHLGCGLCLPVDIQGVPK